MAAIAVAGGVYYYGLSSQPKPVANVKISAGVTTWSLSHVALVAATEFGFWQREGVKVEWLLLRGGPDSVKALVSGDSDFSYGAAGAQVGVNLAGADNIKIVLSNNVGSIVEIVANTKIKGVSDLKGANWGVESIGGTSYGVALKYLASVGMKKEDVNWVVVGSPPLRLQALIGQKIDVAVVTLDQGKLAVKYSYLWKLATSDKLGDMIPEPTGFIATRSEIIKNSPKVIKSLAKGFVQASRALSKNQTLFNAVMEKIAPGVYDKESLDYFYKNMKSFWAVNGAMSNARVQKFLEAYYALEAPSGQQKKTMDELFEYRFIKEALKDLGVEQSQSDKVDYKI